ncbi:MAG TPA: hypothetical protein VNX00_12715, partial [Herbaspirillum sp.]|nr:hypothetical protein [Herbaspirillum sp.]
ATMASILLVSITPLMPPDPVSTFFPLEFALRPTHYTNDSHNSDVSNLSRHPLPDELISDGIITLFG